MARTQGTAARSCSNSVTHALASSRASTRPSIAPTGMVAAWAKLLGGKEAYTVTFGDRGENEAGMQMIGQDAGKGVSVAHLRRRKAELEEKGVGVHLYELRELLPESEAREADEAALLVVKGGVAHFLEGEAEGEELLLAELRRMPKDTTSLSYGAVRNKHARHNNTIGDFDQEPDIANGKGTVVNFKDYPLVDRMRRAMAGFLEAPFPLVGELNHYYDADKCGIGWHGCAAARGGQAGGPEPGRAACRDLERKLVAGMRVGPGADGLPLRYQWFRRNAPVGKEAKIELDSGDLYMMSEKAVGFDWKLSSKLTLRHAAGKDSCSYSRPKRPRDDAAHEVVSWRPGKAARA